MKAYRAYGLTIRSALELPELTQTHHDASVDVEVCFGPVEGPLPEPDVPRIVRIEGGRAYLAWSRIGRFVVTRAGQVTIDALTDQTLALRFALLGPVMAAYLQLNGVPILHGSAVAVNRRAIICIGRKTAGKSTMAAALVAAGCTLLNDDVVPLTSGAVTSVTPGFPALKLSPSARMLLLRDHPLIDRPEVGVDKLVVSLPGAPFGDVPVGLVVILDPDGPGEIVDVAPVESLAALLQEGYSLKFGDYALEAGQGAVLFAVCARLAHRCRIVRLGRTADMADIRFAAARLLALVLDD